MRLITGLVLLFSIGAQAQESIPATVENGKAFIEYKASNGETIFGLSRMYGLEPKDLAFFNKLDIKSGLKKDQALKIPLTTANLQQSPCKDCGKVIYKVQAHEGLYRIGVNIANVGMTAIKKLNSLATDAVSIDQELLVGYVKNGSGTVKQEMAVEKPVIKTEQAPKEMATNKEVVVERELVAPARESVPTKEAMAKTNAGQASEKSHQDSAKANSKKMDEVPVNEFKKEPVRSGIPEQSADPVLMRSAFETQYNPKNTDGSNGLAATFKTTSGWSDGKYYALMNRVTPGTIVKVTSRANNKSIYAKVLGEMPVLKENDGLLLRISDAASGALGSTQEQLEVSVNF